MKKLLIFLLLWSDVAVSQTPSLSLARAYELAEQNYPLIKQRALLRQTTDLSIDNLSKAFLPQVNVSAQATYQSDVTKVTVPIPGINIPSPGKDQYKIVADVNQLLYDGGVTSEQKNIQRLSGNVEEQRTEVELYKVKERINQLFLGVLFIDEQLKQAVLIKTDINNGIKKVEAQVNNGVAFRSSLNALKAEYLKTEQREIELTASRKGLLDMLSLFINQPLPENTALEKPVISSVLTNNIERPEIKLFASQDKMLAAQTKLVTAKNIPRASVFAQGGYGRPGLNFLNNDFAFFYTTGIRFSWNIGGLYSKKNDKKVIEANRKMVDIQKEVFILNTNTALQQQQAEIDKYKKLIATDDAIIALRQSIKEAARAQLDNSVITSSDYLREVNAEDQARQSLITHTIQLLQAQINYLTTAGKQ